MARVIKVAVARVVKAITPIDVPKLIYNNAPEIKAFNPLSAGIAFTAPASSAPILSPAGGNIIDTTIRAATVTRMTRFVVLNIV